MNEGAPPRGIERFAFSVDDLGARIRAEGWGFWRGYILGILSAVVITYPILMRGA